MSDSKTTALREVEMASRKVDEWNAKLEAAMEQAAADGASLRAIAEAAHISHETVRYQLQQARLHSRPTKPSG